MFWIFNLAYAQTYKFDPGVWYTVSLRDTQARITKAGLLTCEASCNADPNCVAVSVRPLSNFCLISYATATRDERQGWNSYIKVKLPTSTVASPSPVAVLANTTPTVSLPLAQPLLDPAVSTSLSMSSISTTNTARRTEEIQLSVSAISEIPTQPSLASEIIVVSSPKATEVSAFIPVANAIVQAERAALITSTMPTVPQVTPFISSKSLEATKKPLIDKSNGTVSSIEPSLADSNGSADSSTLSVAQNTTNKSFSSTTILVIVGLSTGILFILITMYIWYRTKGKKEKQTHSPIPKNLQDQQDGDSISESYIYTESPNNMNHSVSIYSQDLEEQHNYIDPTKLVHEAPLFDPFDFVSVRSQYNSSMNSSSAFQSRYSNQYTIRTAFTPYKLSLSLNDDNALPYTKSTISIPSLISSNPSSMTKSSKNSLKFK